MAEVDRCDACRWNKLCLWWSIESIAWLHSGREAICQANNAILDEFRQIWVSVFFVFNCVHFDFINHREEEEKEKQKLKLAFCRIYLFIQQSKWSIIRKWMAITYSERTRIHGARHKYITYWPRTTTAAMRLLERIFTAAFNINKWVVNNNQKRLLSHSTFKLDNQSSKL